MYHFDWSEIRPEIKDTVLSIEKRKTITLKHTPNLELTEFQKTNQEWFMEYAKTSELVQLLEYNNAAVKGHAFQSLVRRGDLQIFDYVINSLHDKDTVYLNLGCLGGSIGVTEYYLSFLGYYSIDKLSKDKEHLFNENQIKILDSIAITKKIFFYN